MKYWLMKTEPAEFSIEDLKLVESESWTGVRNYQARNFMRDDMGLGDQVLIYHSSCKLIGVAGIAKIAKTSYPDPTQFDKNSKYYDPKATFENPRWFLVDVAWIKTFREIITLKEIKSLKSLSEMHLVKKGSRLSIQPVSKDEFNIIKNWN